MREILLLLSATIILILSVICYDQGKEVERLNYRITVLEKQKSDLDDELCSYRYLKDRMDGVDTYAKWLEHANKPSTIRRIEALRKIEFE